MGPGATGGQVRGQAQVCPHHPHPLCPSPRRPNETREPTRPCARLALEPAASQTARGWGGEREGGGSERPAHLHTSCHVPLTQLAATLGSAGHAPAAGEDVFISRKLIFLLGLFPDRMSSCPGTLPVLPQDPLDLPCTLPTDAAPGLQLAASQAGEGRLDPAGPRTSPRIRTDSAGGESQRAHKLGRGALLTVTLPFTDLASTSLTKSSVLAHGGSNSAQHFAKPESHCKQLSFVEGSSFENDCSPTCGIFDVSGSTSTWKRLFCKLKV